MSLSTRKLFFISGNPNYEVHKGIIEFYEDVGLDWALSCSYDKEIIKSKEKYKEYNISNSNSSNSNISILQCIVAVPSFMIHQVRYL